jgi:hypothetical protein
MHDLFPSELAEALAEVAGKSYRPANATEGELFRSLWCGRCLAATEDDAGDECPIPHMTMFYQEHDPGYPKQWVISPSGQPMCTEFIPDPYWTTEEAD